VDLSAEPHREIHEIVRGEETAVNADPSKYEKRPTTLLFQCGHPTTEADCEFCAA
jgi:hypothetical protein